MYEPCGHREGPTSDSDGVLLARQDVFREVGHVLSADYVRFDKCLPYIERLSTDGVISISEV